MAPSDCCAPCREPTDRCGNKKRNSCPPKNDNMCDPCSGALPPGCTCTSTTKCAAKTRDPECTDPCMGPQNIAKCKAEAAKKAHCGVFGAGKPWEDCKKSSEDAKKKLPYCDLRKRRDCSELNGNKCNSGGSKSGESDDLCPQLPPRTDCICELPPSQYPKFCAPKYLCNVTGFTGKWYPEPADDVIVPLYTGPKLAQATKCLACRKVEAGSIPSDCPMRKRKNEICNWNGSAEDGKDGKDGSCGIGMKGGFFQKVKSWFSKGGKDGKEGGE